MFTTHKLPNHIFLNENALRTLLRAKWLRRLWCATSWEDSKNEIKGSIPYRDMDVHPHSSLHMQTVLQPYKEESVKCTKSSWHSHMIVPVTKRVKTTSWRTRVSASSYFTACITSLTFKNDVHYNKLHTSILPYLHTCILPYLNTCILPYLHVSTSNMTLLHQLHTERRDRVVNTHSGVPRFDTRPRDRLYVVPINRSGQILR